MDVQLRVRNLPNVASPIAYGQELSAILKQIAGAACRDTVWAMATVLSVDQPPGCAYVCARHDPTLLKIPLPDRWSLDSGPARLALTALTRNAPVVVTDALSSDELPDCQQQAARRGYRTVVVLPFGCPDAEGRPLVLSVLAREVVAVDDRELAFLGSIVHLAAIAIDKAQRLQAEQRRTERLQAALGCHSTLLSRVLADDSLCSATAAVSALLPQPIVAVDFSANLIVGGRTALPQRFDDHGWRSALQGSIGSALMRAARRAIDALQPVEQEIVFDPVAQLRTSMRVEPLSVEHSTVGALLVFSCPSSTCDLDDLLLEGAKCALSVQMMRSLIRFQNESRTVADLFAELLEKRWRDAEDLLARACRLGIALPGPARLVTLTVPAGMRSPRALTTEMQRVITRCIQRLRPDGSVVLLGDTVICHLPGDQSVSRQRSDLLCRSLTAETAPVLDGLAIVVESQICHTLEDYAVAWEQCRRIMAVARRFQRRGLLTAQDFGPYLMLLGAADATEVRQFVAHTLGAMARHDAEHGTPYVSTLASYLQSGCRHQICADAMALHVTTLRYRLARMQQLFDVTFDTPEQRFALQLALHLQTIIGEAPSGRKARAQSAKERSKAAGTRADRARSRREAVNAVTVLQTLSD